MEVIIRDHDRSKKDGEIRHSVCQKTEHHEYNSKTLDKDVAILHLCKPMMFTKGPFCSTR